VTPAAGVREASENSGGVGGAAPCQKRGEMELEPTALK